ncbi:MAG: DoxX family protein [archaeon GW2011_AR20]|nr:MAG: DoxX family protein [archaeon GW2011_AR20]
MKEYAGLPLRLVLGLVFLVHGYLKLFGGIDGTTSFFSNIGIPLSGFFAYLVGIIELFGGLALILGLIVKVASVILIINMVVAILLVHLKNGFTGQGGYEFPLTLLAGLVTLAFLGAGKLSLQKAFKK